MIYFQSRTQVQEREQNLETSSGYRSKDILSEPRVTALDTNHIEIPITVFLIDMQYAKEHFI